LLGAAPVIAGNQFSIINQQVLIGTTLDRFPRLSRSLASDHRTGGQVLDPNFIFHEQPVMPVPRADCFYRQLSRKRFRGALKFSQQRD